LASGLRPRSLVSAASRRNIKTCQDRSLLTDNVRHKIMQKIRHQNRKSGESMEQTMNCVRRSHAQAMPWEAHFITKIVTKTKGTIVHYSNSLHDTQTSTDAGVPLLLIFNDALTNSRVTRSCPIWRYIVRQFNSRESVTACRWGLWVRKTNVAKHVWTCSNFSRIL
jgi:hypothetical protein